jgi:hypothetical protein
MFNRLYIELQAALLLLAGVGMQGFTEWQCANMCNHTNKLVTDIFVAVLKYQCGLPQGNGFLVEIANLYALLLLMWWNMGPVNPEGSIAPFSSPLHSFPLVAGGVTRPVSSLAYVDDAKQLIALLKAQCTIPEFFAIVQGYCDQLADLSLVIKMGRNIRKCTLYLYNIPEDAEVPNFLSTAWSYDVQGPVTGLITVVIMRRDSHDLLICYQVPNTIQKAASQPIKDVLTPRKYLGVPMNAQLDGESGRNKILQKLNQRISIVASRTNNLAEAKLSHNMLVCQVATYSPICIPMSLQECMQVDKCLLKAYQNRRHFMPCDAKHSIS